MLHRAITLVDRIALRHVVRHLPEPLGSAVTTIGRASRGGGLWFASAAVLVLCGRRGRRAAAGGITAFGLASGVANGPAKWLVRRRRPGGAALIGLRRRGHPPSTSSFPSSHTAAGVAFAVAASVELPVAAPVLVPAAAAVALARMRAVRHYPSDVLGGACLGLVIGALTALALRRWRAPAAPDDARR